MSNQAGWVGVSSRSQSRAAGDGERRGETDAGDAVEREGRGSAWEQMLEALSGDDEGGAREDDQGSLRASIAERLHTRGDATHKDAGGPTPPRHPARRHRR
jgi:hypothetical protein